MGATHTGGHRLRTNELACEEENLWPHLAHVKQTPRNLHLNQLPAFKRKIKWPYKPVINDSADQFSGTSWCSADAQRAIDRQQIRFGDGGFA